MERWRRLGFGLPNSSAESVARNSGTEWPRISIVLATHRIGMLENLSRNILAQDYPNLEVVLVLNNDALDEALIRETLQAAPRLQILRLPVSRNLGSCINLGAATATGAYIAKMDDDDFYGPSYVSDLLLSALESNADVTGKKATIFYFEDGRDYYFRSPHLHHRWLWPVTDDTGCCVAPSSFSRHGSNVAGATLFIKREVLLRFPFDETAPRSTDSLFQLACRRAGMTIYASDEFNFCYVRRAGNEGHLWQVTKETILRDAHLLPSFDFSQLCV